MLHRTQRELAVLVAVLVVVAVIIPTTLQTESDAAGDNASSGSKKVQSASAPTATKNLPSASRHPVRINPAFMLVDGIATNYTRDRVQRKLGQKVDDSLYESNAGDTIVKYAADGRIVLVIGREVSMPGLRLRRGDSESLVLRSLGAPDRRDPRNLWTYEYPTALQISMSNRRVVGFTLWAGAPLTTF